MSVRILTSIQILPWHQCSFLSIFTHAIEWFVRLHTLVTQVAKGVLKNPIPEFATEWLYMYMSKLLHERFDCVKGAITLLRLHCFQYHLCSTSHEQVCSRSQWENTFLNNKIKTHAWVYFSESFTSRGHCEELMSKNIYRQPRFATKLDDWPQHNIKSIVNK